MNSYAWGGGQGQTPKAFRQSCYYLLPFYLTWVPYLALQFTWASGTGYSDFGFVIIACTLVPLQGFWNGVVYFRVRATAAIQEISTRIFNGLRSSQQQATQ